MTKFLSARCAIAKLLLPVFMMGGNALSFAAQPPTISDTPGFRSIQEALDALHASKDVAEQRRIYRSFSRVPIQTDDDLSSLHSEARSRESNVPIAASSKALLQYGGNAELITRHIADAHAPQLEDKVVRLLEQELTDAKLAGRPAPSPPTTRGFIKAELRELRIKSLMIAAGKGHFTKSRSVLWEYVNVDADGSFGQEAVSALAQIGNPDDFERLLAMVEKTPSLHLPVGEFGSSSLPRLIEEIARTDLSRETKGSLSSAIMRATTHSDIPTLTPLLKNTDPLVVETAMRAITKNIDGRDIALATQLLKSPQADSRGMVLVAIGEHGWDAAYVPLLIKMLTQDAYYPNRALAAFYLGQHRVKSALPELNRALRDPVPNVQQNAQSAISEINGGD